MRYLRIIKESPANAVVVNNELKVLTDENCISLRYKDYEIHIEFYNNKN